MNEEKQAVKRRILYSTDKHIRLRVEERKYNRREKRWLGLKMTPVELIYNDVILDLS